MKVRSLLLFLLLSLALGFPAAWGQGDLSQKGKAIFEAEDSCIACHRTNGKGLPGTYPALDGNPFVTGKPQPVIATVLKGRKGSMGKMPSWSDKLDDSQVAAVVTYIRHAWSNKASGVTPALVTEIRKKGK